MAIDQQEAARIAFSCENYVPIPPKIETELERRDRERREEKERQEAYSRSLRGRFLNLVYMLRGRLSDWIAPEGWNDY